MADARAANDSGGEQVVFHRRDPRTGLQFITDQRQCLCKYLQAFAWSPCVSRFQISTYTGIISLPGITPRAPRLISSIMNWPFNPPNTTGPPASTMALTFGAVGGASILM